MTELFLRIRTAKTSTLYLVKLIEADPRVAKRAWRLIHSRGTYDVALDPRGWWTCTCADATYRDRECKHVKAIKQYRKEGLFA